MNHSLRPASPALVPRSTTPFRLLAIFVSTACAFFGPGFAHAQSVPALLDDFSDAHLTNSKAQRILISDTVAGGQSRMTQKSEDGVLRVEGELVPPRGAPGWVNLILPLSSDGGSRDVSSYSGIRLRVKSITGLLSLQVCSPEVTNYDYHNTLVVSRARTFEDVRIPFEKLKRSWSEQTPLNLKNVTSVNLLAVGFAKGPFAYAVDEIGFY